MQSPLEVNLQQTYESAPVIHEDEFFDLFAIDWSFHDKNVIVEQLMIQMQTVGFCLIKNVPGFDEDEIIPAL